MKKLPEWLKTAIFITLILMCIGTLGIRTYFNLNTSDAAAISTVFKEQKAYIRDCGGYYVESTKVFCTRSDGRKDSTHWLSINPDTTVHLGYERPNIFIIDFDIDGTPDRIEISKQPDHPISESEWANIPRTWIVKDKKARQWNYHDGIKPAISLIPKFHIILDLNKKALLALQ
jgi:hypothetical protein